MTSIRWSTPDAVGDSQPAPGRPGAARRAPALRRLLLRTRRALRADAVFLLASEEGGRFLRPLAAVGLSPGSLASFRRDPLRAGDLCLKRVVATGRPLATHRMPDRCELSRVGRHETRARSALVVPVRSGRRVSGVLVVMWRAWRALKRGERVALEAAADLLMPVLREDLRESGRRRLDRARELRAFYGISRLGATGMGPEEVARRGLLELCRALDFTRADLWLLGNAHRKMRLFATYGQDFFKVPQRVNVRDCAFTMRLLRRRQALHHPDVVGGRVSPPENWSPWAPVTSVFGAPVRARNKVFGILTADRGGRRFEMTATELLLGSVLSSLLSEVIYNAIDRQTRARRQRLMALLGRAGYAISVEERLPILARRLARLVRDRTGVHGVLIELLDERGRELVTAAASGPGETHRVGRRVAVRGRLRRAPAGRVLARRRPLIVEEVRELPASPARWRGTRSLLSAPIRSRDGILGVLSLESRRPFAFDEDDVEVFSILGEQIGHAVKRARTLDALHTRQADLTTVSADLERALEEDRRRIARELHDELAQSMTAAKLNLGLLEDLTADGPEEVCRTIRETSALIDRSIGETRRISMDLRPAMLDDLGLLPALRWYAGTFSRRTGVRVFIRSRGNERRFGHALETLLYRFVQEALTNVARHAGARRVRVDLSGAGGRLRAVVADDGIGMPGAGRRRRGGQGLLGMRERIERAAGRFRIESRRGLGTRLVAELPLDRVHHRAPQALRARARRLGGSAA